MYIFSDFYDANLVFGMNTRSKNTLVKMFSLRKRQCMTSHFKFNCLLLATHNTVSDHDETQPEICLDDFDSDGDMCHAYVVEPMR